MAIYTVYASQADEVAKRLDRLAKKAAGYSIPFSYSVGKEHPKQIAVYDTDPASSTAYVKEHYVVSAVDFDVECDELIKANGWTIRAKVEHGEKGNIVTGIGSKPVDQKWYSAPAVCEHCKTNRFRSVTYFCEDKGGNIRQVGRTCLRDYTGINPATAAIWAEVRDVFDTGMDCTAREWENRKAARMYDVVTVLAHSCDAIKEFGYRKSDEPNSTRDEVTKRVRSQSEPTADGVDEAKRINDWLIDLDQVVRDEDAAREAAWAESQANADEYGTPATVRSTPNTVGDVERNCIPLALSGYAAPKNFGRLAYMPLAYERYLEHKAREDRREAERLAAAAASDYVGEVGQKITVQMETARLVTSYDGYYGTTWLYKFKDSDGNIYIWRSSRSIDVCDGVTIKGTVKDHSEYEGVKQTVITRCSVVACNSSCA